MLFMGPSKEFPMKNSNFGVVFEEHNYMKVFLLVPLFFLVISLQAQGSISGSFSPAEDYTWLIAYHLKPDTQVYVADTAIKDGEFEMILPENSPSGTYRLVYAVPQEEFYFDIIYSEKERLELTFNTEQELSFARSQENILFSTYFKEIQKAERRLVSYYTNGSSDMDEFKKITQNYKFVQHSFIEKSDDLMAQEFIKANNPYIPEKFETIDQYLKKRKEKYFDALDVSNPVLQASGFLSDKLGHYIFTALPLETMTTKETEKAMQDNLRTVVKKLDGTSNAYEFNMLHTIWLQASARNFQNLSDTIYDDYLTTKATTPEQKKIIAEIALQNRLRLGAIAPEITWKDGAGLKSLSQLEGSEKYVLIFWSSTCGHCLRELPALHKRLKENTKVKVIAIGLEDDNANWKIESAKLEAFEHAITLGKWDSEYAALYGINATPTYFILDSDKSIIAKPESDKEVVAFLEKE